jgi:glycosyltransferase involved in cell wall biosynthesis
MSAAPSLRILILNYEFPPMGGGAGHASFQIARTLAAKGCEVDVLTSGLTGQPTAEVVDGIRVHRVRSQRRSIQDCGLQGAWSYVAAAQPVYRTLLRTRAYDVIHYFFGLPTGALALCTPGAQRIPSVISLRGSDVPGYDPSNRMLQAIHRLLLPVTRRIWRSADAVVALSQALRDEAQRTLPERPIAVISNAVEELFTPAARNGRARSTVQLLTVARLIPRKGFDDLFQAMTHLADLPIHLTIQGEGGARRSMQQRAVALGLHNRITFSGFRPRHLLPSVYQDADLFVLPSHAESCGLALLEAMACGLPTVVTRVGGMVEHVEDGVHGLVVPPRAPEALAGALRRLIADPALRCAMGERAAGRIRAQYTWGAVTEAYLETYRRAIASRRASGVRHAGA